MKNLLCAAALPGLALGAALALPAAPAAAQVYAADSGDEIIVTGRWSRRQLADDVENASQAISYADLDLRLPEDRKELRHRINLTARYLCDRLGEPESSTINGPSCRREAARDALARIGTIEENWAPRHTAWVRGPEWRAPYASDWASRYPNDPY